MRYSTSTLVFALLCLGTIFLCKAQTDIIMYQYENKTENTSSINPQLSKSYVTLKELVGRVFNSAIRYAMENEVALDTDIEISNTCKRHLIKMVTGLKRFDLWAVQMIDASGKIPNGLLSGMITSFGDYDGCLRVNASGHFRGQYCLLEIAPRLEDARALYYTSNEVEADKLMENVLTMVKELPDFFGVRTSACIPSTCSKKDMETILKGAVAKTQLGWNARVPNCEVDGPVSYDIFDITAIFLLGFVLFLFFAGTFTDIVLSSCCKAKSYDEKSGILVRTILCFSGCANSKRLFQSDGQATMHFFMGFKFISTCYIILVHGYLFSVATRTLGAAINVREFLRQPSFLLILNGTNGIAFYFFISTFLLAYNTMKEGKNDFPVHMKIMRRLLRIMPPMVLMIAVSLLIPHIGSGPVWKENMDFFLGPCRKSWWANLLLFNNYLSFTKTCLNWLWYVTADLHLYIVAVFALAIIKRYPSTKTFLFIAGLLISTALVFANNYYYNVSFTELLSRADSIDSIGDFVVKIYAASHVHGIPSVLGVALGYMIYHRPKKAFPWYVSLLGWSSVIAYIGSIFAPYQWLQGYFPSPTSFKIQLYVGKVLSALCIAWITVYSVGGTAGKPSHKKTEGSTRNNTTAGASLVLGRLCYMAYLTSPFIQLMYLSSSRYVLYFDHKTQMYLFFACLVLSFAVSIPLTILFEIPFLALDKVIFQRRSPLALPTANGVEVKEVNGSAVKGHSETPEKADEHI